MMNRRQFTLGAAAFLAGVSSVQAQGNMERGDPNQGMGRGDQRGMRGGASGRGGRFFSSPPKAMDDSEKRILDVLQSMLSNPQGVPSVPMDDGRFLRTLAEFSDAKRVVEIGTAQGTSAIWFCMALRKTGGKLRTYEIDPVIAQVARKNFERAGVDAIVTLVLGDAHVEAPKFEGAIDVLFLDADKPGYRDYLDKLLPKVRPGGVVAAHNINPGQADQRFVEAITTNAQLDSLLVTLQSGGISVSLKKR
jgi:predicted O-methyltransferase YrrM